MYDVTAIHALFTYISSVEFCSVGHVLDLVAALRI